jgi:hypothetical protein
MTESNPTRRDQPTPPPSVRPGRRPRPAVASAAGDEPASGRLLRLAAVCPRCGARPALRVTESLVGAVQGQEAGSRLGTYQCQRRGCGMVYPLLAAAYQLAE